MFGRPMKSIGQASFLLGVTFGLMVGCSEDGKGGSDASPPEDAGDGSTGEGGGDGLPVPACEWGTDLPELTLPMSEKQGILKGMSRNPSTTCTRQKGTGGPDTLFLLRVTDRSIVELEVVSSLDTVVAVRRVCDDPLSEVACNDTPAGTGLPT